MEVTENIESTLRKTGINVLDSVPWGTHFCLFYENKADLIEVLVPYLKAGLENNEFCMWITSKLLAKKESEDMIRKAVPNFDVYYAKKQIEIIPYNQWYLQDGEFDLQRVVRGWLDKLNRALDSGYAGIRVAGNLTWIEKGLWKNFADYEHQINESIGKYRIICLCCYCLDKCGPSEIIDVVNNHQLALIKQQGKWTLTKNAERKRAEQRASDYQTQLKSLISELSLTEERERRRVAKELQDQISQSLALSKIKLDALRHCASGQELQKVLDEICNSLGQTIKDTRALTYDLSSPLLYELGFEEAVENWLTEQVEKKHDIATEFVDDGQPKQLDDDIRALLFRDVRELLAGVVKHAQATKIKVFISKVDNQIQVIIEDNSVGFDSTDSSIVAAKNTEYGLFGIQEHLEYLGGHLEIESKPGVGCRVTISAPLKK